MGAYLRWQHWNLVEPPRLGFQHAEHGPCCRSCVNYNDLGLCTKYHVNALPSNQCDGFDSIFLKGDRQLADP